MARRRWEPSESGGPGSSASSSPAMSPSHRTNNVGGISGRNTLRKHNAAELLAKVMEQRDHDYDYDDEDGGEDLYQVHLPPISHTRRRDDKRIGKSSVNREKAPAARPVVIPPKFDDESDGDESMPRTPVKIPQKNSRGPVSVKESLAVKPVVLPPKFDVEPHSEEITDDFHRNPVEFPKTNGRGTLRVKVPADSLRNPIEDSEQNEDGKLNGSNVQYDMPSKQSEAQLKYKKR